MRDTLCRIFASRWEWPPIGGPGAARRRGCTPDLQGGADTADARQWIRESDKEKLTYAKEEMHLHQPAFVNFGSERQIVQCKTKGFVIYLVSMGKGEMLHTN